MAPVRRAVIDIGTNSVKLLVADVSNRAVDPIFETSEQTRLGRGFYETHQLLPEAIARTADAVERFANEAQQHGAEAIRVIATSAARDAVNRDELVRAVENKSGTQVEIISGEQEADLAFAGVLTDSRFAGHPVLILDVGGGSTEFILGQASVKYFRESFRLGSVRLLEQMAPSDPPTAGDWEHCERWLRDFLAQEIRPALGPALEPFRHASACLVGTGGAASLLACMQLKLPYFDRQRIESIRLSQAEVLEHRRRLWSVSLEERKRIVGLPPNRADVILTGVAILAMVTLELQFKELLVSTRGLRFGALVSRAADDVTNGR